MSTFMSAKKEETKICDHNADFHVKMLTFISQNVDFYVTKKKC